MVAKAEIGPVPEDVVRRLAPFIYRQETLSRDMAALDRGLDELLGPGA